MKLGEYQSKSIFSRYGIPVPKGRVAASPEEAVQIAVELGGRVVVKAQVLAGGRGKAGGVKLANDPAEAGLFARQILGMEIKGLPVRTVLVDEAMCIDQELYFCIANDRAEKKPVMMASAAGGIDIEEVAAQTPDKIFKCHIDPLLGLREYQARELGFAMDLTPACMKDFIKITMAAWEVYKATDATLVEINPLAITVDGKLLALDGKMVIDDSALFRQPELLAIRDADEDDPAEAEARKHGLSYIKLDGNIACMVNGAGLAMASMDMIKLFGGEPANFLDIGGGARAEKVAAAMRIILRDQNVQAVLLNIFGGITRCDEVARGILAAMDEIKPTVPMVVRLVGTRAAEGRKLLENANMITVETLADAARKSVESAKKGIRI